MKSTITIICAILIIAFIAFIVSPTKAHEGMIALYADPSASSCQAILPELNIINLSLFYVRGDGPRLEQCVEFRLLKSNDDIQLSGPLWSEEHGFVMIIGDLESGISLCYRVGDGPACFEDTDLAFLGTVQVVNISDPDTFTVSVVKHPTRNPLRAWIGITECAPGAPTYEVIGGTFVFNGTCESPENPFQSPTSVQSSTWGAIKGLFR